MTNKQDTNIFSNKGNFNSKRNPLRKTNTSHQPPIPPSNSFLPGNSLLYNPLAGGGGLGGLGGLGLSGSSTP
jgi:hypothetical protein